MYDSRFKGNHIKAEEDRFFAQIFVLEFSYFRVRLIWQFSHSKIKHFNFCNFSMHINDIIIVITYEFHISYNYK